MKTLSGIVVVLAPHLQTSDSTSQAFIAAEGTGRGLDSPLVCACEAPVNDRTFGANLLLVIVEQ